jgi:hypothetical protein
MHRLQSDVNSRDIDRHVSLPRDQSTDYPHAES